MTNPHGSRDALMAKRLVALADTLVADYDVVDLLDQLVHTAVELLPVTQAGLLLLDERHVPHLVASTSESTRVIELFQLHGDEGGPCLTCLGTGRATRVPDLASPGQRWPQLAGVALDAGFRAVDAVPLRLREDVLGALNLFSVEPGGLSPDQAAVAQGLADMATIGILQQRAQEHAVLVASQLQRALDTRIVIEQAKGVLAEFGQVDMDVAFEALRDYSRRGSHSLIEVAAALVQRTLDPGLVLPRRGDPPESVSGRP